MRFVWLLAMMLVFPAVAAQAGMDDNETPPAAPEGQVTVTASAVFENGSQASLLPMVLLARSGSADTIYRTVTDQSGKIFIPLLPGDYQLDAILDFSSTPGIDFASTAAVRVPQQPNATLVFYPAGSITGRAEVNGSPHSGALVRVSCPSPAFDYLRINGGEQVAAGDAGDFLFPALPSGSCMVSASSGQFAGSSAVEVRQGEVSQAQIRMQKLSGLEVEGPPYLMLGAMLAAVLAAAAIYLRADWKGVLPQPSPSDAKKGGIAPVGPQDEIARKGDSGSEEPPDQRETPATGQPSMAQNPVLSTSNPKVKAVLATLRDREAEILTFLLESGGRAKRSQIQHRLLIPKTSLLRNLRSLERKNVVKLTPFGRNLLAEVEKSIFS